MIPHRLRKDRLAAWAAWWSRHTPGLPEPEVLVDFLLNSPKRRRKAEMIALGHPAGPLMSAALKDELADWMVRKPRAVEFTTPKEG